MRVFQKLQTTAALLSLALLIMCLGAPPASAVTTPPTTTVYYVSDLTPSYWFTLGCRQGTADLNRAGVQTRLVILFYGGPALSGSTYGTLLPGSTQFASRDALLPTAREFAHGYWQCTGNDTDSTINLTLTTNNSTSQVNSNSYQQGRAWSNFVLQVQNAVQNAGYGSQIYMAGGYDMEPGFAGTPANSLNMQEGFYSLNFFTTYDSGSADGCPFSGTANCSNGWTVDQRYQAAWGYPRAYSIPEIYATGGGNAKQWGNLSRYGANHRSSAIQFAGVLTQSGACADRGGCSGTNNSPATAYDQLYNELLVQANTAMTPRFSDDVRWEADLCPC